MVCLPSPWRGGRKQFACLRRRRRLPARAAARHPSLPSCLRPLPARPPLLPGPAPEPETVEACKPKEHRNFNLVAGGPAAQQPSVQPCALPGRVPLTAHHPAATARAGTQQLPTPRAAGLLRRPAARDGQAGARGPGPGRQVPAAGPAPRAAAAAAHAAAGLGRVPGAAAPGAAGAAARRVRAAAAAVLSAGWL
jgi:hypothetical protein